MCGALYSLCLHHHLHHVYTITSMSTPSPPPCLHHHLHHVYTTSTMSTPSPPSCLHHHLHHVYTITSTIRFRQQVGQLFEASQVSRDWASSVSSTFSVTVRRDSLVQDALEVLQQVGSLSGIWAVMATTHTYPHTCSYIDGSVSLLSNTC